MPLFELLAELPATELSLSLLEAREEDGELRGSVRVHNVGGVVARLVRGEFDTTAGLDHRLRDGFVHLLPPSKPSSASRRRNGHPATA